MAATNCTRQIIIAKLQAEKYARSNGIGASMLAEKYAKIASEREEKLPGWFFAKCDWYYSKDRNGKWYRTEQDRGVISAHHFTFIEAYRVKYSEFGIKGLKWEQNQV